MRSALLFALVLSSPALAQAPHKEGEYGGVTPGDKPDPSARPARPRRPPPKGTLTWIGFEAKDGGAQVFFQSVAAFQASQHVEGNTLVVHLDLTRLAANTWRQVDTRFFDNPLSGIVARVVRAQRAAKGRPAHGAGIDVRIAFKNPKDLREGTLKSAVEPDGMHYVYVSFPEGTDAKQPTVSDPEQ